MPFVAQNRLTLLSDSPFTAGCCCLGISATSFVFCLALQQAPSRSEQELRFPSPPLLKDPPKKDAYQGYKNVIGTLPLFSLVLFVFCFVFFKAIYDRFSRRLTASITGIQVYRKIPKISPGAYIFQRPFLRGLFLEGLMFGGAYLRREICVSKLVGLAL